MQHTRMCVTDTQEHCTLSSNFYLNHTIFSLSLYKSTAFSIGKRRAADFRLVYSIRNHFANAIAHNYNPCA